MKLFIKKILNIKTKENQQDIKNIENHQEDYVEKCMGSFGTYQGIVCTIAASTRFLSMWNLLSIIFLAPKTDFICNEFNNDMILEVKNSTCYEDCIKYEYFQTVFERTLISQFSLICDRAWLADFTQTLLMLGVLVGSWMFGWISDRYGRRNAFRLATFYNVFFMVAALYSPDYWTFTVLRICVGMTSGGIFVISTVYILEVVGSDHRETAACWAILPDGIAEAILAIFAYCSKTWDVFLMEYAVVSVFIFFVTLGLPESPRWLVSKGKIDRAIAVVTNAAQWNRLDTSHIEENIEKSIMEIKRISKKTKTYHFDLFSSKQLSLRTICIILVFIETGVGFFGINQYVTLLETDIYLSVLLLGLIQVPISLISIFLNKISERRTLLIAVYITTAISMFIQIFLPKGHWTIIFIAVIGLSAIIISYAVLYIYTAELYPTPLRTMALGVGDSGSKLGAMFTPFIATLAPEWIPPFVLAVLPCLAAGICFLLPETKGRHLTDHVD